MPTAVLDKFLSRFGLSRKESPPIIHDGGSNEPSIRVYGSTTTYGMPAAQWTAEGYQHYAREGYGKNSDVYACVSLISSAAKQVKWADGRTGSKCLQSPEALAESLGLDVPFVKKLHGDEWRTKLESMVKPNASAALLDKVGGAAFIESWISHMLLSGNAFIEVIRVNGAIKMLYLDNPGLMKAELNRNALHEDKIVDHWRVGDGFGHWRLIKPWARDLKENENIVQSRMFTPAYSAYGMPPLAAAMMRVDFQNEGQTLLKRILQRGYVPGWIEARENSEWSDEHVAALKEQVRNSKVRGEELFLENAIWHPMGFEPMNSGSADHHLLTKRDIASVFHVDPALIGDTTARTYATYRESRRGLYMECVVPILSQLRDDWNRTIGTELGSPLDFDRDSFDAISAAREEACDRAVKLFSTGLITRAEARSDLEYGPAKPTDEFFGPANLVPMTQDADTEDEV
jgi:HK97 family phage portal protein